VVQAPVVAQGDGAFLVEFVVADAVAGGVDAGAGGAQAYAAFMGGLLAAANSNGGPQVDVVARALAAGSLVVSLVTALLTWYLWRRSGAHLVVEVRKDL
jgi:hypothetical protein